MAKKKGQKKPQVPYSNPHGRTRAPAPKVKKEDITEETASASGVSQQEYSYVLRDMRRIAVLAIVIFAAQFALLYWMG